MSIHKSNRGCALGIVYPKQGPMTFDYKPNENTVGISYQVKGTTALTGHDQRLSFVLNASDPSPDATESATYNDSGSGSATVVNDHVLVSLSVNNGVRLIDFLARAYSISFTYKLAEDDSVEIEEFNLWDLLSATEKLKTCAESVSSAQ
jgi:hypothetical protein